MDQQRRYNNEFVPVMVKYAEPTDVGFFVEILSQFNPSEYDRLYLYLQIFFCFNHPIHRDLHNLGDSMSLCHLLFSLELLNLINELA